MTFQVRTEQRSTSGRDGTVYVLEGPDSVAEVWPALGFNCYRWRYEGDELLFADPQLFENGRPTRSGIPVLFPFPNRIRDGRFTWNGTAYQLPLGDSTKRNAIHGFTCQRAWRVVDQGADATGAWLTGEFQGSVDAVDAVGLWPADYRIRLTYRLKLGGSLAVEAVVENPDTVPLPFGLGYHPYFRLPVPAEQLDPDWTVHCPAEQMWELQDNLPSGQLAPVEPAKDLREPRRLGDLQLDDVYRSEPRAGSTWARSVGGMTRGPGNTLNLAADPDFREVVAFTPPHRLAVCLEPYTCLTDAINLEQQGIDAGLLVLEPDHRWTGTIQFDSFRAAVRVEPQAVEKKPAAATPPVIDSKNRRIYHLLTTDWTPADGVYRADSLVTEGFIHCSNAAQVAPVANLFYGSAAELKVLEIACDRLTWPLYDEDVDTGERFPHVYGLINREAIVGVRPLSRDADGRWEFTEEAPLP